MIVTRGRIHDAAILPGFVAVRQTRRVGLATYVLDDDQCELLTLNSIVENIGVGTALIEAVKAAARAEHCRRLWLVTTNDNLAALRFYQKRGLHLLAVHRDAVEHSRELKPEIPSIGLDGIPLRDEIELEQLL